MQNTSTDPEKFTDAKRISNWLFVCAGFVFVMVIVGAITRLTNSGLSMVEWRPLMGALPPLNEAEWQRVFNLYQASPEFEKEHFWMELSDFKKIFFWEWFHRLLGRTVGLVYIIPLVWFWVREFLPTGTKKPLILLLILGASQGLMGWYMVQSGLVDNPDVSHYRLAAHLSLALVLFCGLIWIGSKIRGVAKAINSPLFLHMCFVMLSVVLTVVWGAFVAGLDAGLLYNDGFPKMGGSWMPPDMWTLQPAWLNIFENHAAVQFTHRALAIFSVFMIWGAWAHGYFRKSCFTVLHILAVMAFIQAGLGVATLMSNVALPLAALHQSGAVIILGLLTVSLYKLKS